MAKTDANRFKKFSKPQAGLKKKKKISLNAETKDTRGKS